MTLKKLTSLLFVAVTFYAAVSSAEPTSGEADIAFAAAYSAFLDNNGEKAVSILRNILDERRPQTFGLLSHILITPEIPPTFADSGIEYLKIAAKNGDPHSLYILGLLNINNNTIMSNIEKGKEYLKKSADIGYGLSELIVGKMYLEGDLFKKIMKKQIYT